MQKREAGRSNYTISHSLFLSSTFFWHRDYGTDNYTWECLAGGTVSHQNAVNPFLLLLLMACYIPLPYLFTPSLPPLQVTREVVVEMLVGDGEVVLKNLSKCLDKDSIRVDGIGPASITEVSYQVGGANRHLINEYYITTCDRHVF